MGFRLNSELKEKLEQIAAREERSTSQVCELLLRGGVDMYEREGTKYLQRILSQQKPDSRK